MQNKFEEFAPVTQSLIDELKYRQKITGMDADEVLLNCGSDTPEGLTSGIIVDWMKGVSKQAKRSFLSYVLRVWDTPDNAQKSKVNVASYLKELEAHRTRTDCGSMAVLKGRKDVPEGLKSSVIDSWVALKVKTTKPRYLDYVLQCYRELDSLDISEATPRNIAKNQDRRCEDLCSIDHALINFHFERTGVDNSYFTNCPDAPAKVNSAAIHRLRNGLSVKMYRESYGYILKKLVNAPDMSPADAAQGDKKDIPIKEGFVFIQDDTMVNLVRYRDLGLLPSKIFKHTPFKHENPKPHTISNWISGNTRTAKQEDLEFVLKLCETVLGK